MIIIGVTIEFTGWSQCAIQDIQSNMIDMKYNCISAHFQFLFFFQSHNFMIQKQKKSGNCQMSLVNVQNHIFFLLLLRLSIIWKYFSLYLSVLYIYLLLFFILNASKNNLHVLQIRGRGRIRELHCDWNWMWWYSNIMQNMISIWENENPLNAIK